MPVINRIADAADELTAWRRHLHETPELMYDLPQTAAFVAERLRAFGCDEVVTGIGRSGVVGVIKGQGDATRAVALRADMDALPIHESTGAAYASRNPGKMHACGHDGHTTMLLGAARHLAETRRFAGSAILVFQPAEEGGAGGRAMVEDGLMDRFAIEEVYGMHNLPGLPVGRFALREGAIMASADHVEIIVAGRGAHAARPDQGIDAVLTGASIVTALQQVVARNVDPLASGVVSISMFHAGDADNVLPQTARLVGTMRSLSPAVRQQLRARVRQVAEGVGAAFGASVTVDIAEGYPATLNHADQTAFARAVAEEVVGAAQVDWDAPPLMAAEDFAYMLEARPGAYLFIGNGDSAGLHHPAYDFSDAALPVGASFWVRLIERALPL
ncbi:M20 aminoacylase family protein [Aquabacter spiritensis]|uniref:Hippurate hydrolase n=1 Tax=Aquabacter spiritensis TaxID=933073 RepID=A0A4R3LLW0_9HYPH|nr:M20 aminoacylase family protein [Aquabacter spiritensis]TCT00961.1 hippurate hydrolase [Aquabacter spiritensis]